MNEPLSKTKSGAESKQDSADILYANIYDAKSVRRLFDEMSKTYGVVNLIASLGFTLVWRRVCIQKIRPRGHVEHIVDLLAGMGELMPNLYSHFGSIGRIQALDFSSQMCEGARKQATQMSFPVEVIEADVFDQVLLPNCADVVVSSFGLKTFSKDQQAALAKELDRVLKPGGEFSFIEISMPNSLLLRAFYKLYINLFIPMIGKFCLGNPDNYRHLGVYTEKFKNSQNFHDELLKLGIESNYFEHFFGCASGVCGRKRPNESLS